MKPRPTAAALFVASLTAMHLAIAEPATTPEQKITTFLWSAIGSTEDKTELIYYDVKDNYTTRITFTRDKLFTRSDGMHGMWHFESGKLVLTGLDKRDGFTIIFDPLTLGKKELSGRIPKGRWKGHKVILRIPPK